ncbi:NADP-dependent 3-hydroxy acid dehydrogenase YdfG [Rhodobium orientis]|uniref:Short-chain dehydrogenase/reductase n=1 Tax=Rhodobium orientis TaxID=34017 RepID=A0A327JSR4_9HYPH|nr:oxidoreductase [Rhodobium orientis]MBB4303999.1 NADP-dependent 3-hydroxy acid dehydrogenase YdfG [Rhodobium orientis]MBK5950791.1 short-chain dehydrogenase/reductase [Rhodobium orientis]RAI29539.1 short-chain dehydrogenase/reductase [Rhodobium orientis]
MSTDKPVWFVTGCSTGFGREIAKLLLSRGFPVAMTARRLESIADLVEGNEDKALALTLDVTDPAMIDKAVADAEARFGRIDVLVNNAGYGYFSAIEEGEDAEIRRQFETNVFGLNTLTQKVLPGMRARRSGHIFNFSSIGGLIAYPALGYYNATKFAVEALSEALAKEVAPLGIKVTIIEPGGFRTDWAGRSVIESKTVIDDYAETAGALRKGLKEGSGHQDGDPVRAAAAVLTAYEAENPPLRLLMSAQAYGRAMDRLEELRENFETWKDLTLSTDYPEGE